MTSSRASIKVLGAGGEIGRSSIYCVFPDGLRVLLDCGAFVEAADENRFPLFSLLTAGNANINDVIDIVLISHLHVDHCGGLVTLCSEYGYEGPIIASTPTAAMLPSILLEYSKQFTQTKRYNNQIIELCTRVRGLKLGEALSTNQVTIQTYYASHVVGAVMFKIIEHPSDYSIFYTGDFSTTTSKLLGPAIFPKNTHADCVISEGTYASLQRGLASSFSEHILNAAVRKAIDAQGKVLIPVFALGRAQDIIWSLQKFFQSEDIKVPIYLSAGMAKKVTFYYDVFNNWTDCVTSLPNLPVFEESLFNSPGPFVLFATSAMMNFGLSHVAFKRLAPGPNNLIVLPGYSTPGTLANQLLVGAKKIQLPNESPIEVKCTCSYIPFSLHADQSSIINLISCLSPIQTVLVHGEYSKLMILKRQLEKQLPDLAVSVPKTGESIDIIEPQSVPVPPPCLPIQPDLPHAKFFKGEVSEMLLTNILKKLDYDETLITNDLMADDSCKFVNDRSECHIIKKDNKFVLTLQYTQ